MERSPRDASDGEVQVGWRDESRALHEAQLRTLREIEQRIAELRPAVVREERPGRAAHPGRFPALRVALTVCRDVTAGEGLVQRFRRIPDEYVDRAERRVRCLCGASVPFGDLQACPGGCGRWMASDSSGAWAAKFEEVAQ
jgi:hypothetical protein